MDGVGNLPSNASVTRGRISDTVQLDFYVFCCNPTPATHRYTPENRVMLSLLLRDLNASVVTAWRTSFSAVPFVDVAHGSILDVTADAIVSPANSFGYMDGGIDLAYCHFFGFGIQERLQSHLREKHFGELPVGTATIIETGDARFRFMVSAPTMRVPCNISRSINVYLAFRAALISVVKYNERESHSPIRSLAVPGLGTGIGGVHPTKAANHMRLAYNSILGRDRERNRTVAQILREHHELLLDE